ncbi:MAG: glucosidase [Deltaproteobacteria bacterium]|nr:glucosidase [Deltaproteobacteria bacterium]
MTSRSQRPSTPEHQRIESTRLRIEDWKKWGPYLAERSWGTVREDYSAQGDAWNDFPFEHARSRAYRWCEDGLAGICDREQRLCFGLALWNGNDPILKERLFGVTGPQGNHGEAVKECYFYLDNTPTHSYMRMLYKYPQAAFPYRQLIDENGRRGRDAPEFDLRDTRVFDQDRYWDVFIEYAKSAPDDILIRITLCNRGAASALLHVLGVLWFRNTWSWDDPEGDRPRLWSPSSQHIRAAHPTLGEMSLHSPQAAQLLFTENDSNLERLWGVANRSPYVKDALDEAIVRGRLDKANPAMTGTRAAAQHVVRVEGGGQAVLRMRLTAADLSEPLADFEPVFAMRAREADAFHATLHPASHTEDERRVQRQAFAGLLWSKQYYHYDIAKWIEGDPAGPTPPASRHSGRNHEWSHLHCSDILSMPDKWEYPWFAAWDLAFHCIALAPVDPVLAKRQLVLLLREWYMHPNGQIPAYEWEFSDVNPPVHAWAAWRVYKIDQKVSGLADREFLERVFLKLLLNFTWWVNRKDATGKNVFQGGFLGMDNIGVFDRSRPMPHGGTLEQSDGTSWMGMFCLNMLVIALELARSEPAYEDVATKFFEHFMYIADAMDHVGGDIELWSERDGFFYDVLKTPGRPAFKLRVRSMVGLIPLLAVETIEPHLLDELPRFARRMDWFLTHRPRMARLVSRWQVPGAGSRRLLALLRGHRMKRVLKRMLDPEEFLSEHGVRSLSKVHAHHPYELQLGDLAWSVAYDPGVSRVDLFGGNSNWRGPVWMPVNYLLIEALQKFHHYYSDDFRVECPTGSGKLLSLGEVADELARRMVSLFLRDASGRRAYLGPDDTRQSDPLWRDHVLFHEYFDGDTGLGLGASHQTGWTALVAKLLQSTRARGL